MSIELIETLDSILRKAGYRTRSVGDDLYFEDDTVLGFASAHESAADILASWEGEQEAFLRDNADALRGDRTKAWNVYSVFLSCDPATAEERGELQAIEQDFRSTRKIARAGLKTAQLLQQALVPILPLPTIAVAVTASPDEQLADKLDAPQSELLDRLRSEPNTDTEIIEWLSTEG